MTDTAPPAPAPMNIRPVKPPLTQRLALVWVVPVLALVVSLGAAWQNYRNQGVPITLLFQNAAGITAGATEIRYRDVTVGVVEDVSFGDGLDLVQVIARVDQDIAPYLDDDAQFWVVRPDVSVRGISGLDTVLSGVYIEGSWDVEADVAQTTFRGLDTVPLTRAGQAGTSIVLRSPDAGSLSAGAPVLHKGIVVGFVESPMLTADGASVEVRAFIEAPYDRRITSATRFWDTSGFSVSLGTAGVALNVSSLASLIEGGVAFDTVVSGGAPVRDGQSFALYPGETEARDSFFTNPDIETLDVAVLFDQSVTGLTRGAEVRFQGIRVGEVREIGALVVGEGDDTAVRLQAVLAIQPTRLGLGDDATVDAAQTLLAGFVARGLRARLVTGNILTATLLVELVQVDDAPAATMIIVDGQLPVIPTTVSEISDVAATAEGVLARINNLPIEGVMEGMIDLMASIEGLVASDATRAAPAALLALLDDTRALVASDDLQAVPADLRRVITNINAIVASAADADLVTALDTTLAAATSALGNIDAATRDLPRITADIAALTARANELELEALIANASNTLASVDAFIAADTTRALPGSVNGALDELRVFLSTVREGGAVDNANAALQSASAAALALEQAVQGLPALSTQASALVRQTETVLAGFGERSRFNAETLATLREIQGAANAVSALARAIQRNPQSLLTGR